MSFVSLCNCCHCPPGSICARLCDLIKERGLGGSVWPVLKYILRKGLGISWKSNIFLERVLDEPIPEITPKINVVIRQAIPEDWPKFKEMFERDKYLKFRDRFSLGEKCIIALDGERIAGQQWLSFNETIDSELNLKVKVNHGEAYFYDAYVIPEYRNNRLQLVLAVSAMKYLQDHGYHKGKTIVAAYNINSLKTCASIGFQPVKSIFFFTVFGIKCHRWGRYKGDLKLCYQKYTKKE